MNELYFSKDAREKLLSGINKAYKAVAATLGPNGSTVIIGDPDKPGQYKVTKDGVSVINSIVLKDPIENIGVQLLREAANRTVNQAGDGTTTATVLATAFINNLKDFNTIDINKAFDEIIPKVIEQLKLNSRKLENEDIKYVASISANNDMEIGNIIQSAYNHTSIVKVEESKNLEDNLELVNGMNLPVSFFSKNFITDDKKGVCEFKENLFVLLVDGKLDKLQNFKIPFEFIQSEDYSLLIIAEDVHELALRKLETFALSNQLNVAVIKTPGFSKHRKDLLQDLSKFTGATIIKDLNKEYTQLILGKLDSCKITKTNSILVKHEDNNVTDLIDSLKQQSLTDIPQHDVDLLKQRIEYLEGKVSIIKVGGGSELEMKERKDRYDDAVLAVACALEEGIVEGGGIALMNTLSSFCRSLIFGGHIGEIQAVDLTTLEGNIACSLLEPMNKIKENGAIFKDEDLFKQNIIDPLKVTRCALENAVSIAKVILSTEAVVLKELEWRKN